ncbi:MAG: hypothetical protein IKL74_02265 [Clostridia bacterium]|nr:hypothetical protein [Clostridia bacterium]
MTLTVAYPLMALSILFSVINACLLHKFGNKDMNTPGDLFFFNGGISIIWMLILAVWFTIEGGTSISPTALIFGVIYGVILCTFLFFKMRSMAEGPVSLSTLIGSCAFVIATWFGVFYVPESISIFQIAGQILLFVSLFLCVNPKKSGEKLTAKWFVYSFLFFLAGGAVGIIYKVFAASDAAGEYNGMMLTASIVSAILFFVFGIFVNLFSRKKLPKIRKSAFLYIVLCGTVSCVYIRLNLSLSAVIPSAVFFPVSNGAMVILSTITGKLFFSEKLNKVQITGILIGLIAIVITGCSGLLMMLFI